MNKLKRAFIAVLLGLCAIGAIYAKSYEVMLERPTVAGDIHLPPGNYQLEYSGSTATLTSAASGKHYKLPVKVTTAEKKFKATRVDIDEAANPVQLKYVELGGSSTRLEFVK